MMEPLKKILLRLRNVFTKKDDSVIPTDFSDLAPLDSIDNTSEYLNALDWALKNRRIRNVALCGPYGAGKSSIINSYLKSHADAQQKSLLFTIFPNMPIAKTRLTCLTLTQMMHIT